MDREREKHVKYLFGNGEKYNRAMLRICFNRWCCIWGWMCVCVLKIDGSRERKKTCEIFIWKWCKVLQCYGCVDVLIGDVAFEVGCVFIKDRWIERERKKRWNIYLEMVKSLAMLWMRRCFNRRCCIWGWMCVCLLKIEGSREKNKPCEIFIWKWWKV